ncbi:MAG: hypothetical protein JNN08_12220 [Bryobacterales bacterium]|nr:hypothetical protein [Bryobacterales bacterium]
MTDGKETKVALRIQVQSNEVYAFQPLKGGPVKISFHESDQRHIRIGKGKPQLEQHETPAHLLIEEESLFGTSFENFATLLSYKQESFDVVEIIDFAEFPAESIPFVEVAVGRVFRVSETVIEPGYMETVVRENVVRKEPPGICIRVKYLSVPTG